MNTYTEKSDRQIENTGFGKMRFNKESDCTVFKDARVSFKNQANFIHSIQCQSTLLHIPVIQRSIKCEKPADEENDTLYESVNSYNRTYDYLIRRFNEQDRADLLSQLHTLLVKVLESLNELNVPDLDDDTFIRWRKGLLNAIQNEHLYLVMQVINHKDEIPPIANFEQYPQGTQETIKDLWSQLISGEGNIKISEYEQMEEGKKRKSPNFRYKVFAALAHLLETETGRSLIGEANEKIADKNSITIKPQAYNSSKDGYSANPLNKDRSSLIEVPDFEIKSNGGVEYKNKFVLVKKSLLGPSVIYEVRKNNPDAIGIRIWDDQAGKDDSTEVPDESDDSGAFFKFNVGTAVDINFLDTMPDAAKSPQSRYVDSQYNEIPSMTFILLGHELGHAIHHVKGEILSDEIDTNLDGAVWTNYEEFANIKSVENGIRRDLGIKEREGHINQLCMQCRWLIKILDVLNSVVQGREKELEEADCILSEAGNICYKLENPEKVRLMIIFIIRSILNYYEKAFSPNQIEDGAKLISKIDLKKKEDILKTAEDIKDFFNDFFKKPETEQIFL